MGLLDFVKDAGAKLFGGEKEAEPEAKAKASPQEIKKLHDRRNAMALVRQVEALGLAVEDLSIKVDDDLATVAGKVADQALREKIVLAIGNTTGIARVDDQLEVAEAQPEATFHTVVRGDTLSGIAKQYYGNAMKYPVIFEANKPMLSDPDKIYPGQVLRIPPLDD